jgi:Na+/melibiose symporter-like transporter
MEPDLAISNVARVIQLAVAPVFLITGIGAMLAVMTNRLARVIDRARTLEAKLEANPGLAPTIRDQLATLSRRAKLVGRSITLCTMTALLISAVIAILFMGAWLDFNAFIPVAALFIIAMFAFILALFTFLREIRIATAALQIGPRKAPAVEPP